MLTTTTKNGLTYIRGEFLSTPILIQAIDREQARDALKGEMLRIWNLRGYAVPKSLDIDSTEQMKAIMNACDGVIA